MLFTSLATGHQRPEISRLQNNDWKVSCRVSWERLLRIVVSKTCVMHVVLVFCATHGMLLVDCVLLRNKTLQHRGAALGGLRRDLGSFAREAYDSIVASSLILCWQATYSRSAVSCSCSIHLHRAAHINVHTWTEIMLLISAVRRRGSIVTQLGQTSLPWLQVVSAIKAWKDYPQLKNLVENSSILPCCASTGYEASHSSCHSKEIIELHNYILQSSLTVWLSWPTYIVWYSRRSACSQVLALPILIACVSRLLRIFINGSCLSSSPETLTVDPSTWS
jgi:hypothetical protein